MPKTTTAPSLDLGLVYFKPGAVVVPLSFLRERLTRTSMFFEVNYSATPLFVEDSSLPLLGTSIEVLLGAVLELRDHDNTLRGRSLEVQPQVGLFNNSDVEAKSFTHPAQEEVADETGGIAHYNVTTKLGDFTRTDSLEDSLFLRLLRQPNFGLENSSLRGIKWFEQVAQIGTAYAAAHDFINKAEQAVISDGTLPIPPAEEAQPNPLAHLGGGFAPRPAPMPMVTSEQVNAARERKEKMKVAMSNTFLKTNQVVFKVPAGQLSQFPEIEAVITHVRGSTDPEETFDDFLAQRVKALIESSFTLLA